MTTHLNEEEVIDLRSIEKDDNVNVELFPLRRWSKHRL